MLNKARLQGRGKDEIDQDEDRLIDIVELIYRIWCVQLSRSAPAISGHCLNHPIADGERRDSTNIQLQR